MNNTQKHIYMILNGPCFVCSLDLNLVFRMCLFELFGQTWPLGPIYVSNQCQVCIDKDTSNLSDYAALALAYEDPRVLIVGFWVVRRKKQTGMIQFHLKLCQLFYFCSVIIQSMLGARGAHVVTKMNPRRVQIVRIKIGLYLILARERQLFPNLFPLCSV